MKQLIRCSKCECVTDTIYKCDNCDKKGYLPHLTLIIDLEEYDFCNYSCLLKFIIEELKKENKNA